MNRSLVPANTKRSTLILGMLRPIDAWIFGIGTAITVFLVLFLQNTNTILLIISCLPMLIAALLVLPIPNYHNVLVVIQSIWQFYTGRRNYIWRGWCLKNELKK